MHCPGRRQRARARGRFRTQDRRREWTTASKRCGEDRKRAWTPGCDLFAVGRPDGLRVAIDTGIEIGDGFGGEVVDGDKGMIAASGDKSKFGAVGRPAELAGLAFEVDELGGPKVSCQESGPDFVFAQEDNTAPVRSHCGIAALIQFARDAVEIGNPDGLVDTLGETGGIRIVAAGFKIAAADENHRAAVGSPSELRDFLAVVVAEIGEPTAGVSGTLRDPHVASTMFVEHPGDGTAFWRSDQVRWERSAHHLFEREACGRNRERKRTRKKKND